MTLFFSGGKAAFHLDCTEANTGNLGLEFVHGKSGERVYFWLSVKSLQMQRSLLAWVCEASSGMHLAELGLPGELQQKPAEDSQLSPNLRRDIGSLHVIFPKHVWSPSPPSCLSLVPSNLMRCDLHGVSLGETGMLGDFPPCSCGS